jgi:hypothetical protein
MTEVIAMSWPDPDSREARREWRLCALSPGDDLPSLIGQRLGQIPGRERRVMGIASYTGRRTAFSAPALWRQGRRAGRPEGGRGLDAKDVGQPYLGQRGPEGGVDAIACIGQNHAGRDPGLERRADLVQRDLGLVWKATSSGTPAFARRSGSCAQTSGR